MGYKCVSVFRMHHTHRVRPSRPIICLPSLSSSSLEHIHHRSNGRSPCVVTLVVRIQSDHFRLHTPLRLAKHRQTEHPQCQPKLRQHSGDDQYFPERIEHTEPHDAELQQRIVDGAEHQLVDAHRDEGEPRHPEGRHQGERHRMAGIGQVLGQRRCVLLVVDGLAGAQLPDHHEDVAEIVHDRDDRGSEHENRERCAVRGHIAPVQFADVRLAVVDWCTVAEKRRTAEQRRRDPGEGHPALAPVRTD